MVMTTPDMAGMKRLHGDGAIDDTEALQQRLNAAPDIAGLCERLRGALEPIAARPVPDGCTDDALIGWISAGAIREARAALTGEDHA